MLLHAILFLGGLVLTAFLRSRGEGPSAVSAAAAPAGAGFDRMTVADAGSRERNPDPGSGLMDNFGAAELRRRRQAVHGRGKESAGTVAALFPDRFN